MMVDFYLPQQREVGFSSTGTRQQTNINPLFEGTLVCDYQIFHLCFCQQLVLTSSIYVSFHYHELNDLTMVWPLPRTIMINAMVVYLRLNSTTLLSL